MAEYQRLIYEELRVLQSSLSQFLQQKQHWWPSPFSSITGPPISPIDAEERAALCALMCFIDDRIARIWTLLTEAPRFAEEPPQVRDMFDNHALCEIRQNMCLFSFATWGLERRLEFIDTKNMIEDAFDYVQKGPAAVGGEELRYLLVSSGCAICLLDLEQMRELALSNLDDEVQPLLKRATLKLIDEQLPVSVGLFSLGSDAYLIGGHMFPATVKPDSHTHTKDNPPSRSELYFWLIMGEPYPPHATSCATYRLTLDEDGKMTHSPFKWGKELQCPKFWPIVEEFEGQIHVFDSDPNGSLTCNCRQMFSHEVLECDGWRKILKPTIPPLPLGNEWFVRSHLVLGQHIYAIAGNSGLLFDFEEKLWKVVYGAWDFRSRESVFDILLQFNNAWKLGEIRPRGGSDLFYVVFVLEGPQFTTNSKEAVAYLVASTTGKVVCRQVLFNFFSKGGSMQPLTVRSGSVIKADKEGKTMCAIITGNGGRKAGDFNVEGFYVFIYTFTVKELCGFVVPKHIDLKELKEFVRVEMKDSFVFETNAEFDDKCGDSDELVGIQACFVEDAFVDGCG